MAMDKMKWVGVLALATALAACGGGDDNQTAPAPEPGPTEPAPEPEVQPQVLLEQSFAGLSALPAGWTVPSNNRGTVSVADGALVIDGRAHSSLMTAVMLPAQFEQMSNYRIDVAFTFAQPNNASRWGSVMYRAGLAGATVPHEPYYQFAIRQAATAANGTEFALRRNNGWNVQGTKAFSGNIDASKTYTATVVVHGKRVRQYLDNVLLHDMTLDEAMAQGGIGLQTTGMVMRVSSVKVTEQRKALPEIGKLVAVQETGTRVPWRPHWCRPWLPTPTSRPAAPAMRSTPSMPA
jgi:hypothetical protein